MNLEEKYGENFRMSDSQIEREQQRINNEERLRDYKECIEEIKRLANKPLESFREYENVFEKIKNCVEDLYENYS